MPPEILLAFGFISHSLRPSALISKRLAVLVHTAQKEITLGNIPYY